MHDSPGTMRRYVPAGHRNAGVCFSAPHGGLTLHLSAPLALQALCMRAHIYAWLACEEGGYTRTPSPERTRFRWMAAPSSCTQSALPLVLHCTALPPHSSVSTLQLRLNLKQPPHPQYPSGGSGGGCRNFYHIFYVLRPLQLPVSPLAARLLSAAARRACWRRSALPGPGWLWPCAAASACPPRCVGCPPAVWPGALPPPRPPFCCPGLWGAHLDV